MGIAKCFYKETDYEIKSGERIEEFFFIEITPSL